MNLNVQVRLMNFRILKELADGLAEMLFLRNFDEGANNTATLKKEVKGGFSAIDYANWHQYGRTF